MCWWRVSGFLLLLVLALSPRLAAFQLTRAQGPFISGYVRDDRTEEALPSVSLELKKTSGEGAAPATMSGTTGEFQFNGINSGDYYIVAQRKGYAPAQIEVRVASGSRSNVIVPMHKLEPADTPTARDPISSRELSIPSKAREAFEKGVALMQNKRDYQGALTQFQRAVQEYPPYYEAYAQMGVAYFTLGI